MIMLMMIMIMMMMMVMMMTTTTVMIKYSVSYYIYTYKCMYVYVYNCYFHNCCLLYIRWTHLIWYKPMIGSWVFLENYIKYTISICFYSMKMPLDCCRRLERPAGSYRTMHSKVYWSSKNGTTPDCGCQTVVSVAFCTGVEHTPNL